MNGRIRNIALIGALAFVGTLSLLSCSSSDPTSPSGTGSNPPGGGVLGDPPSISFVDPELTCASAGNVVTVYGNNLDDQGAAPTVTINGVAAQDVQLFIDATLGLALRVVTNADPSTIPSNGLLVDVTVQTSAGTTTLRDAIRIFPDCVQPTASRAPIIVDIDPPTAPRTGGSLLTISGANLACVSQITLTGTLTPGLTLDAPIVSVIDDNTIVVESPVCTVATSETYNVTVASNCGADVLASAFVCSGGEGGEVAPNATAITPPEGPAGGGNQVRITGADLAGVDTITIGSTTLTLAGGDFIVQANGEILIPTMPPSPIGPSITVPVNVTVSSDGTPDSSPVVYTYLGEGAPECGTIAPTSGTQLGGTSVIITAALGSQLDSIDGVLFGGVPATGLVHPNSSQLAVTTPAYPVALDVEVELTVGGVVVATCPIDFTYTPSDPSAAFSVDSIFPDQGPQSGGTQIQIAGSGLTAVTSIQICDVQAAIQATAEELVTAVTGRFDGTTPAVCDVVVQAGGLGATLPAAFTYTPVVPDGQFFINGATTAPEAGGLNFRIQGSELIGVTNVSFSGSQGPSGQALACEVQVQGNTEVTGIVPRYFTPGGPFPADVDVFVSSNGGIDPDTAISQATGRRFRYYANPRLVSASGPGGFIVMPGQTVTVDGTNFMPETDVFVASLEVSNSGVLEGRNAGEESLEVGFTVLGNNQLQFVFPTVAVQDYYDITIRTPLPELECTQDYSYTLLRSILVSETPTAAAVDPPRGPFTGGTQVTITGDFDTEVTRVTFNGIDQSILEQTPNTVLVATRAVPEATAGTPVDVVVTALGGVSPPLVGAYTFIPQPDVLSASSSTVNCGLLTRPPTVLPVTQGQIVTVTGTDLIGVDSATVGGEPATVFPISDTTVEVAIPPMPMGGPVFDLVLQATFPEPLAGTPQDTTLFSSLLTALRYQDPPTVAEVAPATADPGSFVVLSGTNLRNADGSPVTVEFGGTVVPAGDIAVSPDGTQISVRVPPGPEGMAVQVQVTTCQGSALSLVPFTYPCNPPVITSLLPTSGSGGTPVNIGGTSLLSADGTATTVTFGGQQAVIDFATSTATSLNVTAPPGNAGDRVPVELTTCGGDAILAGFFTYGCGAPQVTGITPAQGSVGTVVVISGANLDSPDGTPVQVLFGTNTAIVDAAASSATQLVVTAPTGVGAVTITVTNCGGSTTFSAPPYTYCNPPMPNLLPPTTGAVGDIVMIGGSGLLNPDTTRPIVRFGGVEAVVLEAPTPPANNLISVRVPENTGNVIVEVETCGGIRTAGSFQYCERPEVTGFTPPAAPALDLIVLAGSNLIGADGVDATVSFGPLPGIPGNVVDNSPFTVEVPASPGLTGTVQVRATTCGGTSTALFTICETPVITDVNVNGGLPQGPEGTAVSIVGTDFIGADGQDPVVVFGTQVAPIIDAQATALLVSAPPGIANGTTVTVRVTTCGGTGLSGPGDDFTYMAIPACPTPPSGAAIILPAGATGPAGTQVTIEGQDLIGADGTPGTVLFGAFPATLVASAEDAPAPGTDTLVVTAPDGGFPDGFVAPVTIQTCGGPLAAPLSFTYLAPGDCPGPATPTITMLAPVSGGPDTQVTIEGTNLFGPDGNVGTVRFGAFEAVQVTAAEDVPVAGTDTIVVRAPDGGFADGTVVDVTVENCAAISAATNFTYQGTNNCPGPATPAIAGPLSPAAGGPNTQVTIVGTDLIGPDGVTGTVRFGAFTATEITSAEDVPPGMDTIVVSAPDGGFPDGTVVSVRVETCFGMSAPEPFTYQGANNCPGAALPVLGVLNPASGGVGTQVTIQGSDLIGPDGTVGVVRFEAFTANVVAFAEDVPFPGNDQIVVTAPDGGFADGFVASVTVETCVGLSAIPLAYTYQGAQACPGPATPTITTLAPNTGGPGTQVTITGSDLFGPDGVVGVVRFGAFTATQVTAAEDVPSAGTDTIVVTAPDGGFPAGTMVDVTVETCIGISAAMTYTYQATNACPGPATPVIGTISPNTGDVGTQVTLTGNDLIGPDGNVGVVRFDAFTATVVTSTEDVPPGTDTIVVTAPDGGFADGTLTSVTVETCFGVSAGVGYTYTATCLAPAFVVAPNSINPDAGPAGTVVTLMGTNFIGADGADPVVQFGTRVASLVTVSAGSVVVEAPAGIPNNVPVAVRLTTCGGTATSPETYTYTDVASCMGSAPGVASLSSNSGAAGDPVQITGTDLIGPDGNVSQVRFGTFDAQVVDFFDDPAMLADTMLVVVPTGPPIGSTVTVSVENCAGTDQTQTFMYETPTPCSDDITAPFSITPGNGTANEIVTITGNDLIGDDLALTQVFFGVEPATVLDQTEGQLLVRAPANVPSGETVNVTVSHCGDTEIVGTFTYDTVFDVQTVAPDAGPRTGGQTIFITGTGLSGVSGGMVTICGVAATVVNATNTVVEVNTGAYFGPAPATCDVFVTDGVSSDTLPAGYTYTPLLPDGDSLDDEMFPAMPAETAPSAGGTTFRIRGTDLLDVSDVTFGGLVNDPKACDLQAQNDGGGPNVDLLTGTTPAYRTPGGPFPADVQIFVESAAGRDNTPVTRNGGGAPPLFTYYRNPDFTSAFTDDDLNGLADADCGVGCGRPGRVVRLSGTAFSPEFWAHVGTVTITEVGGGSGLAGSVPFSIESTGDGGGANTLTFTLPGNAEPNDVFDVTIATPSAGSSCTTAFSVTRIGAVSVEEFLCDDGMDGDADGDIDCQDQDCQGQTGPGGEICQPAGESICNDGGDNDGDGLFDCADPDCDGLPAFPGPGSPLCEAPEANCGDGFDNDADGLIDCVTGFADPDCPCGPETAADMNCADGVDNDDDGNVDAADPDC